MQLAKETELQLNNIKNDNTHGATEIAARSASILSFVAKNPDLSAAELIKQLRETAKALVRAQPAMAPLVHLASDLLQQLDELNELEKNRLATVATCDQFIERLNKSQEMISKFAADLIHDGMKIMTHSSSSTVLNTLLFAKSAGKRFDVICLESRPLREGVELAKKLGQAEIPVKLIVDAAAPLFLRETSLLLVGGDAVLSQGLFNKIGTLGLALAAKEFRVPFYALCDSTKFLPEHYPFPDQTKKGPAEIENIPAQNVTILNYYFDLTPLESLTGIVSEEGMLMLHEVKQRLKKIQIHPSLCEK